MSNTGGPAFPRNILDHGHGVTITHESGMTLRDYFAAKCLQGYMVGLKPAQDIGPAMQDKIAGGMYSMADAMLKAREA
jgi:hypothetical protein